MKTNLLIALLLVLPIASYFIGEGVAEKKAALEIEAYKEATIKLASEARENLDLADKAIKEAAKCSLDSVSMINE